MAYNSTSWTLDGSTTALSADTLTTLTVDNIIVDGTTIGHTSDTDLMTLASGALTVSGTVSVGVEATESFAKGLVLPTNKYNLEGLASLNDSLNWSAI